MNKAKTVKTITCHGVYNYGASLQEMALLEFLNHSGFDAEAIDYKPDYLSKHHKLFVCENPNWNRSSLLKIAYIVLKLPKRLQLLLRKKRFNKFENKYIKTTSEKFVNNEELKSIKNLADFYICGSDQIWNPLFKNGSDPSFYLDFAVGGSAKTISYAASFATDSIPKDKIEFVKQSVSKIDSISVRETSGKQILSSLGIKNVEQVLDPVFLLNKEDWERYLSEHSIRSKYIFVYDFDSNLKLKELARSIAKKHGFLIVGINDNLDYVDKNFYLHGPSTFLSLVKDAELVLTTSFHALAFGLIFQRRIAVFNRSENINTRMKDLLELLNLNKHLLTDDHNHDLSFFDINYADVDVELLICRERSKNFLLNAVLLNEEK